MSEVVSIHLRLMKFSKAHLRARKNSTPLLMITTTDLAAARHSAEGAEGLEDRHDY